ncbi:MAG: hypothetical protein A3F68_02415 [Acidobacteria bacterium RIFCSPLOWO2_12_FULL_54_10]|nr:MAG: hypothetical protein A3F68_02415 [Acidobacteria bacterium RIFCSPLOWO2_12_FULL_54_10]
MPGWLMVLALLGMATLVHAQGGNTQRADWMDAAPTSTGLKVGEKIPAFRGTDQNGQERDFQSIKGPKGAVIVFSRSADWCPYCKTQLIEMEQYIDDFKKQGLGVVAMTYDSTEIVADFAKRHNITYPLLGDSDFNIIRAFGVLNTSVPEDHTWYGVPYPGTFIVDQDGVVRSKYFEDNYRDRYSAPTILLREFGSVAGTREMTSKTPHLEMKYYSTKDVVRPNLHFTLVAVFQLPPKMHVYSPEVEGYIPIDFALDASPNFKILPAAYPKSKVLFLEAIDEKVPVYEGKFRITQDVILAGSRELQALLAGSKQIKITGKLRYQACDDKICYLPQTLPMEWTLALEPLDTERVPEELRRK